MLRVSTWPFRMVWSFIGIVFLGIGKLLSMLLGVILAAIGVALCCTIIGAIIGVPLVVLGVAPRHSLSPCACTHAPGLSVPRLFAF